MRATVVLLTCLGAFLGALPVLVLYLDLQSSANEVVYNGSYGPLRGVEMTRSYETSLNLSFEVRSQRWLTGPRLLLYPAIGALTGLAIGVGLTRFGWKLSR